MILTNVRLKTIIKALEDSEMTSSAMGHKLGVTTGQATDLLTQMREKGAVESYIEPKTRILLWRLPATGETISNVTERLNRLESDVYALKETISQQSTTDASK